MNASFDLSEYSLETLHINGEFTLDRGWPSDGSESILVLRPEHTHTEEANCQRLEHEYDLGPELDAAWATCPLALKRHRGRPVLVLTDPGGTPLDCLIDEPLEIGHFLEVAISLATAVAQAHARGLVHKDIKPANVLVNRAGKAWLTGFGLAIKTGIQRQPFITPLIIKGTWAYMSPEQTGRVNRFVDSRSDLYSLGITFYEMLSGALPFEAADPLEWIHCHIARQPTPLRSRRADVPKQIDVIVMKLLAKTGEDRYQTAGGLQADLERCLQSWRDVGDIDSFTLAAKDVRDKLAIPDGLYGRERPIASILSAFERVAATGDAEIVLISGPAGIGKSSMMNELQLRLTSTSCLFAAGKSDQFKLDIPYPAMANALQSLVRRLLSLGGAELDRWRRQLLEALGSNGQLMINLVPELSLIIGEQSLAPDLPPHEAQSRFHVVFRRFLAAFAQPAHPLTLFIDDLQWLDTATLELIERLAVQPQPIRHLLLIGAYRDDEINSEHRLASTLTLLRNAKCRLVDLRVGPLTRNDLTQLTADTLRASRTAVRPLTQLLLDKTKGNPFFVVQFMKALREESLLYFDTEEDGWRWDADGIAAKSITDNVADLLAHKLTRLPIDALEAVKYLACLGNGAQLKTLCLVSGQSERALADSLAEAVRAGFVVLADRGYAFSHDRMQEAAYKLIAAGARGATHLRIGRALVSKLSPAAVQEHIFEVVEQFGHGAVLISSYEERAQVAQLYLNAGKRAKSSTAYASALKYFREGRSLLNPDDWDQQYHLFFDLELCQAECEFLTGDQAAAQRLSALATRARDLIDASSVARLRIALYTLGDPHRAIEVGLSFILCVGIKWSPHPSETVLRDEIGEMTVLLAGRPIERLIDLPSMTDPLWLGTMDVLAFLIMPAKIIDNNLENIVIVRMANLSLQHGNCDASSYAYSQLNVVLGLRFGDYRAGLAFGQLGCDLVETHGMERFKARVYTCYSSYGLPWVRHLPACRELKRRALSMAEAAGDLAFIAAVANALVVNLLISGEPLAEVHQEAENYLALARKAGFGAATDGAVSVLFLICELRGIKPDRVSAHGAGIEQARFEDYLERGGEGVGISTAFYWRDQLQARYLLHDTAMALEAATKASKALTAHRTPLDLAEYHYYAALARAAACDEASGEQRQRLFDLLRMHQAQISVWAANCRDNFGCREALVGAEIARLEGNDQDAAPLYDQAIRLAQEYGFVPNEAIANELAARFHMARGPPANADTYLRAAFECYGRWGADGKIERLRQQYPHMIEARSSRAAVSAIGDHLQHVDLTAVIAISQAVSSEVEFDRLVERLLVTVLEHAGAVRGIMLLPRDGELQVAAEALAQNGSVEVNIRYPGDEDAELPDSILNYVKRSREIVILDDAQSPNPYSEDRYIHRARPRSVLCMPLLKQQQLVAILYIENHLLPSVFTPERLLVLTIIGSQAAISIENAKLFADLKEAREQARRAEEQNQQLFDRIPAMAWRATSTGAIDYINKTWTDYTGISTEEASRGEWMRAYPGVDGQTALNQYAQLFSKGIAGTVETWLRRHDGEVRWFLHRVAPEYDARGEIVHWHGTATDIDDLMRAQALIVSEKDLLQMNTEVNTLAEIFEALTRSVEKQIDTSSATLLLRKPGEAALHHIAAATLPKSYTSELDNFRGGPFAGTCGVPTEGGQKDVFVSAIATDPSWAPYRDLATVNGLVTCWSTDVSAADGASLGILVVYTRTMRDISHREIRVCEQFAHIASVILERKRSEDALKGMNLRLQESLHEKESLLKEVHHRVKNNLQLISSMLSLQASRINDGPVSELFAESRNRVRSMAMVHENLYRAGNFSKISMVGHIETLSASLARAYGLNSGHIELQTQVEDILLDLDVAIPIGLIVNELTSNALKHAYPNGRQGRVIIALRRLSAERCELTLCDNGVGISSRIDPHHSTSMGLQLVQDLTEQLHGTIVVTREGGTTFTVSFDSAGGNQ